MKQNLFSKISIILCIVMNIVLIGFICPLFLSLDIAGLQDPNITSEMNTRFIIVLIFYIMCGLAFVAEFVFLMVCLKTSL